MFYNAANATHVDSNVVGKQAETGCSSVLCQSVGRA